MRTSDFEPPWRDTFPAGRLLRPAEVVKRTGISRSQIYQMISEGRFPPFIKLSSRASALPEAWLQAFVSYRASAALGAQDAHLESQSGRGGAH